MTFISETLESSAVCGAIAAHSVQELTSIVVEEKEADASEESEATPTEPPASAPGAAEKSKVRVGAKTPPSQLSRIEEEGEEEISG